MVIKKRVQKPLIDGTKSFNEDKWVKVVLRLPAELKKEIDYLRKERVSVTRTLWILEAIQEKNKKELSKIS